jgi:hypothetical protein
MATKKDTKKSGSVTDKMKGAGERLKENVESGARKVADKVEDMTSGSRSTSRSDVSPTIEPEQNRDLDTSSGEVERPIDRSDRGDIPR